MKNKTELAFEREVIDYLCNIGGTKQWQYKENIKTTEQLWSNFKSILEQNNRGRINGELSRTEFNQVKEVISNINTPYKAGQFLYGVNGVSEIEVDLDTGEHVFLVVFDQAQVGAGNTIYQVVNQIQRDKVVDGKKDRRFDITLLINGLPIVQIEVKKALHTTDESLNQMKQYIAEKQYSDIFSTLQILVAMTPYDTKYMANTTLDKFNTAFSFNWQNEKSKRVRNWKDFSNLFLSIPMAHDMATRYMILDGTKNKECIKVMRPYQVYATQSVLRKLERLDFSYDNKNLGYVWHTTGSGKTITSFKTAWLASRLSNVEKVVFLVDRIALTNQTADAYKAYDPVASFEGKTGVISDTANVSDLHRKLTGKGDNSIIVTSIQKMSRYVTRDDFKEINKKILFIVDEAHRSTGESKDSTGMLKSIRKALPLSAWVGYTGTPKFEKHETAEIFGELLHAYTIKEAIADKNVLGFNVEFKETIEEPQIDGEDDYDDLIKGSVYDTSPNHVNEVVKDIFTNWNKRSNNRKYNALFTVHVGGNKASTPRVMEYFDRFEEENQKQNEKLKIAVSFSVDTSNGDRQLSTNENLHRAINHYNEMFNTAFDMTTVKQYTDDLARRLNKTSDDGNYLDLVIVVDQLLTGFDAPELNTLYVDRTLKGGNLIQAYSRTNRMQNIIDKPWGNVVNYRWPERNEFEMNKAFAIYSNRASADEQLVLEEIKKDNEEYGIISRPYEEVRNDLIEVVNELESLTNNFNQLPNSEKEKDDMFEKLKEYNQLLNQLKQYSVDSDNNPVSSSDNPEEFLGSFNMDEDKEIMLTTVLANELKEYRAKKEEIDISQVNLSMTHVNDIRINYDYLIELIAKMANEINNDLMEEALETKNQIEVELAKSDSEKERNKVGNFVNSLYNKEYQFDRYPVSGDIELINEAIEKSQNNSNLKLYVAFIREWGTDGIIIPKDLDAMIKKHDYGQEDMDKQGEMTKIINSAKDQYLEIASDTVKKLSWLKYRIEFRKAFYDMADEVKKGE